MGSCRRGGGRVAANARPTRPHRGSIPSHVGTRGTRHAKLRVDQPTARETLTQNRSCVPVASGTFERWATLWDFAIPQRLDRNLECRVLERWSGMLDVDVESLDHDG